MIIIVYGYTKIFIFLLYFSYPIINQYTILRTVFVNDFRILCRSFHMTHRIHVLVFFIFESYVHRIMLLFVIHVNSDLSRPSTRCRRYFPTLDEYIKLWKLSKFAPLVSTNKFITLLWSSTSIVDARPGRSALGKLHLLLILNKYFSLYNE